MMICYSVQLYITYIRIIFLQYILLCQNNMQISLYYTYTLVIGKYNIFLISCMYYTQQGIMQNYFMQILKRLHLYKKKILFSLCTGI